MELGRSSDFMTINDMILATRTFISVEKYNAPLPTILMQEEKMKGRKNQWRNLHDEEMPQEEVDKEYAAYLRQVYKEREDEAEEGVYGLCLDTTSATHNWRFKRKKDRDNLFGEFLLALNPSHGTTTRSTKYEYRGKEGEYYNAISG